MIYRVSSRARSAAFAAAAFCALAANPAQAQPTQDITLRFAAEFLGKPFTCGQSVAGIGVNKSTVSPADFRIYVSNIELVRADGSAAPLMLEQDGKWQYRNVALLDFENGAGGCANGTPDTRQIVTGKAAAGKYTGVRFQIGVPFELNHQDPTLAPSPLNLTAMFWTWQGGYKFVKIDFDTNGNASAGKPMASGQHMEGGMNHGMSKNAMGKGGMHAKASGFAIHLGSTLCKSEGRTSAPSACANSNRMSIAFNSFDPAKNVIVFDPAPVLAASNVEVNTPGTSPGCMSFLNDPECNTVMPKLGFAYGGKTAEPQAFVRMR